VQVMVFDFGCELYVWNGKDVTPDQRRLALRLSQELWEHGYDYTGCGINPLSPLLGRLFFAGV
jgi:supervillin